MEELIMKLEDEEFSGVVQVCESLKKRARKGDQRVLNVMERLALDDKKPNVERLAAFDTFLYVVKDDDFNAVYSVLYKVLQSEDDILDPFLSMLRGKSHIWAGYWRDGFGHIHR